MSSSHRKKTGHIVPLSYDLSFEIISMQKKLRKITKNNTQKTYNNKHNTLIIERDPIGRRLK